ncbi:MAG: VWA-like domain-containing protein [Lachnospiraceae bacterium]|nr:VWA-like domain-containing protein [Lachnospiraceae bacterium]
MNQTRTGQMDINQSHTEQIREYAAQVMNLARDSIMVRFRFFDSAIARIRVEWNEAAAGAGLHGGRLVINPVWLLKRYMEEPGIAARLYLHCLLHLVFLHQFQYEKLQSRYWDLACDIAVENIILEMHFPSAELREDSDKRERLRVLSQRIPVLTADRIYREFTVNGFSDKICREYERLFILDSHEGWRTTAERGQPEEMIVSEEDLRKITRRIRAELKSFSQNKSGSESLEKNVDSALKERYNYREILQNFMVTGEEMGVSEDEFDYVYYTYGLSAYGNMPLVEPLEYREHKKIREFVIAIDTSASCRGEVVRQFIRQTWRIMKDSESFFQKINVHIIQCDAEIRSDVRISSQEDFDDFMEHGQIRGFGSTDFRPVFEYVDALMEKGEFENLAGLIYFTDGYGVYPERMPDYDVIFAFLNEDENRLPLPPWAGKVVLEDELLLGQE